MTNKLVIPKPEREARREQSKTITERLKEQAKGSASVTNKMVLEALADLAEQNEIIIANQEEILKRLR